MSVFFASRGNSKSEKDFQTEWFYSAILPTTSESLKSFARSLDFLAWEQPWSISSKSENFSFYRISRVSDRILKFWKHGSMRLLEVHLCAKFGLNRTRTVEAREGNVKISIAKIFDLTSFSRPLCVCAWHWIFFTIVRHEWDKFAIRWWKNF